MGGNGVMGPPASAESPLHDTRLPSVRPEPRELLSDLNSHLFPQLQAWNYAIIRGEQALVRIAH